MARCESKVIMVNFKTRNTEKNRMPRIFSRRCKDCGRKFSFGEKYVKTVEFFDVSGSPYVDRYCIDCEMARHSVKSKRKKKRGEK